MNVDIFFMSLEREKYIENFMLISLKLCVIFFLIFICEKLFLIEFLVHVFVIYCLK